MGSYCALRFDERNVLSFKSSVPEVLISLFQETDRRETIDTSDPDEDRRIVTYSIGRRDLLERLDVLGATARAAADAFEKWRAAELLAFREYAEDGSVSATVVAALEGLSYADWASRVPAALANRFEIDVREARDEVETRMLDRDDGWLFFEQDELRVLVRALLEACPNVHDVILDIDDLIGGGYLEGDVRLCENARVAGAAVRPLLEPTIILGEGSSDIRILRRSLSVMFPHLVDYFGFFEHGELNVDGGVGYLVKFLKAFAAARISTRMIALFDNDTIGCEAFAAARTLSLPVNITVLRLPNTELARSYPSIGPQGSYTVDVNGRAAGIEMYLGRGNLLAEDGALTPVLWRGYSEKMKDWQGELRDKAAVVRKFEADIGKARTPADAREAFPELASVWHMIFATLRS
jgi:hypothetical protein